MSIAEIKKNLENEKLVIGTDRVLKNLKANNMTKVFLSSNVNEDTRADVNHFATFNKVEVEELGIPNDEVGVVCKKGFAVSVLGFLK